MSEARVISAVAAVAEAEENLAMVAEPALMVGLMPVCWACGMCPPGISGKC